MTNLVRSLVRTEVLPPDEGEQNGGPVGGEGSPLHRLREQMRAYPPLPGGDPRQRALLYGGLGSVISLVGAGVAAALPPGSSIRSSGFYVIGKGTVAGLLDVFGGLVVPLAIVGGLLLVTTLIVYLTDYQGQPGEVLCAVQPMVGVVALGGSAAGWLVLIGLVVLNLLLWLVVIALVAVAGFAILAGLLGAMADG